MVGEFGILFNRMSPSGLWFHYTYLNDFQDNGWMGLIIKQIINASLEALIYKRCITFRLHILCHSIISEYNMLCFMEIALVLVISTVYPLQALIIVDSSNQDLTVVPQNVDVNVGEFNLVENHIEEIDSSSFARYTGMQILRLDKNPLRVIGENTFAQNQYLWRFHCTECNIQSLPVKFGSCVPYLLQMHLFAGINPDVASTIFTFPYFEAFVSLDFIGLMHLPLGSADNIKLPSSLRTWITAYAGLTSFPNLTYSVYPLLYYINVAENPQIKVIPDEVWKQISDTLHEFQASNTGLSTMVDLTLKQNLRKVIISNNHLETVPDLLNMTSLTNLKIAGNSRMTCDRRMCWRRLWDRMRAPLASSDDVICVQPPELAGYKLSVVNPKLMSCVEGTISLFIFGICYKFKYNCLTPRMTYCILFPILSTVQV